VRQIEAVRLRHFSHGFARISADLVKQLGVSGRSAKSHGQTWIRVTTFRINTYNEFPPKALILNDHDKNILGDLWAFSLAGSRIAVTCGLHT
jgi:hypothetical protein